MPDAAAEAAQIEAIRKFYGGSPRVSEWITVTQNVVNQYCEACWDSDWMHVDVERSQRESPFGSTVAPGFWSLSMLPYLARLATGEDYPPGIAAAINYGFDRVRFPGPVLVGSRVRLHLRLADVTPRDSGRYLVRTENTIEVEGRERPALVAEWMFVLVFRV
ncbi:MAG: MaoC family dehydratase [Pirellulales bacterium]